MAAPRRATGDAPPASNTVTGDVDSDDPSSDPTFNDRAVPAGTASLVVRRSGGYAVSDPDRDSLWILDNEHSVARRVRFAIGAWPSRVAEDSRGILHVVLRGEGVIAHVDPATSREISRTRVCENPRGVAVWPDTETVFVACEDGTLSRFDWRRPAETMRSRAIERDLRDVVASGGSLWVNSFRTAHVWRLSDSLELLESIALPAMRVGARAASDAPSWVASVAWKMIATRAGGVALALQYADSSVLPGTAATAPVYYTPDGAGCGSLVVSVIAVLAKDEPPRFSGAIGGAPLMVDLAERTESGDPSFAVISVSNAIATRAREPFPRATQVLGHVSHRALASGETGELGCMLLQDTYSGGWGETVAVAAAPRGGVALFNRDPVGMVFTPVGYTSVISRFEVDEPRQNTGYQVFHGALPNRSASPIACASCHPEGLDDGRVWSFPSGARRTQSLLGTLDQTGPYHWDGDLVTMSSLVREVWSRRMAMGALSTAQTRSLLQWLLTLPVPREERVDKPESVARGRALFESPEVQCAQCHSGSMLTNNQTMDVGTQGLFQVPSLRGLRRRAPYMHNGCAATLADRFSDERCGGGERHGHTAHLNASDVEDLVAYLESL
ncbi:MAG: c-type cytochrome [Polyangiales bacterium]